jgi:hypothetical protein
MGQWGQVFTLHPACICRPHRALRLTQKAESRAEQIDLNAKARPDVFQVCIAVFPRHTAQAPLCPEQRSMMSGSWQVAVWHAFAEQSDCCHENKHFCIQFHVMSHCQKVGQPVRLSALAGMPAYRLQVSNRVLIEALYRSRQCLNHEVPHWCSWSEVERVEPAVAASRSSSEPKDGNEASPNNG